jgi:O-succinylbenzoic acid--CoA ligase
MLRRLLDDAPGRSLPAGVRLVLLGGAAAPDDLVREALDLGIPVALTYGLTEAGSQAATALPAAVAAKPGSVGKALYGTELRILRENGEQAEQAEPGEIVVRGPGLMRGYLGEPPLDGWLHTGDIGCLDPDGDLFVLQRRSDLVVTGGENVYPAEVEAALRQHPSVQDACVVGLPDPLWGQSVAAAVAASEEVSADELIEFLRGRLAGYKVPRKLVVTNELPCTASGKVCRPDVIALIQENAGAAAAPEER